MLKICIYIGINAHVTPADRQTDGNVKVEQYSAEAESAKSKRNFERKCLSHSFGPEGQQFLLTLFGPDVHQGRQQGKYLNGVSTFIQVKIKIRGSLSIFAMFSVLGDFPQNTKL